MGNRFVQERVLGAAPERVFACWSDAGSMGSWMCPGEIGSASVEIDFRVGGAYRIVMQGTQDYVQHGEYIEIDVPRRIVMTWISDFVPPEESRTRVTITFEPAGEGRTRIVLVHDELPGTDTYAGHEQGWADILAALAAALDDAASGDSPAEPRSRGVADRRRRRPGNE
ncbi:MAG: SRPBCC domain-containing protein [Candidatus Binatia bacterium]